MLPHPVDAFRKDHDHATWSERGELQALLSPSGSDEGAGGGGHSLLGLDFFDVQLTVGQQFVLPLTLRNPPLL